VSIEVLAVGTLALIQDRGRPGWAHLGVPRSGALDAPAAALANRLVGNDAGDAVLEVLLGGLAVVADAGVWVAVTGAPCAVEVDGRPQAFGEAVWLPPGGILRLGTPQSGLRSYLAFAGGIVVEAVLGSRASDTLGGLGPPPLRVGDRLPVGAAHGSPAAADTPRPLSRGPLRVTPGPRATHVAGDAVALLCHTTYTVSPDSDRVGLRLMGDPLPLAREDELPSEGIVRGAVQVPSSGQPLVFLADHPTTGGYPVPAYVVDEDVDLVAQLRPGDAVRFRLA